MLAQVRRPAENVAAQLMALIPLGALALVSAITDRWVFAPLPLLGALTVLAAILHPTGRDIFRSFTVSRVNRVMVALVVAVAGPLLAFAATNIGLQKSLTDEHAGLGHYGFMAAFGFTVIGVGLLASLRPAGWRLPAWAAGTLPFLLGLTSLLFPAESSLGLEWALVAVAWGMAFIAIAELTQNVRSPALFGSLRDTSQRTRVPVGSASSTATSVVAAASDRGSTSGTPRWKVASGLVLVALALILGVAHVAGSGPGGPGGHTSPVQHGAPQP